MRTIWHWPAGGGVWATPSAPSPTPMQEFSNGVRMHAEFPVDMRMDPCVGSMPIGVGITQRGRAWRDTRHRGADARCAISGTCAACPVFRQRQKA